MYNYAAGFGPIQTDIIPKPNGVDGRNYAPDFARNGATNADYGAIGASRDVENQVKQGWGAGNLVIDPMFAPAAQGQKTVAQAAHERQTGAARPGQVTIGELAGAKKMTEAASKGGGAVSAGKTGMDSKAQAIMDRLGVYDQRIEEARKAIAGVANPFDPNSDTFKRVLSGNTDIMNRRMGADMGNQQAALAQRGMAAGGQGTAAMFDTSMARRAGVADMETRMYADAMTNGANWEMSKAQGLASLATGNLAAGESALGRLLSTEQGNYQFDEGLKLNQKQFETGIKQWDKTFEANENWRALDREDKERWLTVAQANRMDERQTQTWGNLVTAAGPTLAKGLFDMVASGGIQTALGFILSGGIGAAGGLIDMATELLKSFEKPRGDFWQGA